MPKPVICIDMDEVLADALGETLLRYNRDFADELITPITPESLHGRWLWDAVPSHRTRDIERYLRSDDFFSCFTGDARRGARAGSTAGAL